MRTLKYKILHIFSIDITSDAQRSSVWRSVASASASAERSDFTERERALERLTPERRAPSLNTYFLILEIQFKRFFIIKT